ncbi:MAG: hypothetical protein FWC87_06245 [Acidimicrobiaceae bacterium]|nr:hypothetical protein [Acidimicrobiaceae bacterium]
MAPFPTALPTAVPTAPVAAGSLIGGYLTARFTRIRPLGGVVLAIGGALCTRRWQERVGTPGAVGLLLVFLGAFGLSHPLAKRIGAWPSVLAVSAAAGGAAWAVSDRRR